MKVLLWPNLKKDHMASLLSSVIDQLLALGITPMLCDEHAGCIAGDSRCVPGEKEELAAKCDVIMPVGGDGTVMRAAKEAVKAGKPILGVNGGRVGFLTRIESGDLDSLSLLRDGRYEIEERMMLRARIVKDGCETEYVALNDILVGHGASGKIVDMEVLHNDRMIWLQRGDGIIFSTPTGSTAYSFSAGGPVADPEMELILLTPICPHATFRCPLILPANRAYAVREVAVNRRRGLHVTVDGKKVDTLEEGDLLIVQKYPENVRFLKPGLHDFYRNLTNKLTWKG